MSDYFFQPVPVVEILVALHPTILVRDMEKDRPGIELSSEGLDTLYFRIQIEKRVRDLGTEAIVRAIDCEAEGVVRDLASYLRTSGWDRQVLTKALEAFVTVTR